MDARATGVQSCLEGSRAGESGSGGEGGGLRGSFGWVARPGRGREGENYLFCLSRTSLDT
eukprot:scaffold18079_cov38-Tisochrysis_lutea.AAC.1